MKARYLTFFSYIGTPFRSSEKIWLREGRNYPDPQSVQGLIELGLQKLRSLNYPSVTLSSRTDGGVHALNSSAHFDLDRNGSRLYNPNDIVYTLNKFFYKSGTCITVRKCQRVADHFSARFNAVRRTYLYRLAVLKKDQITPERQGIASQIPIEEWKRCHFIGDINFDIDPFIAGSKYLVGYHDFTTFKRFDREKQHKHNRREIYSITVRPGRPVVTSFTSGQHGAFDYWDIEIRGRAFVHNQIRRMIGTLISVAIGKLAPEDIKVMLQVPSKHSWHNFIQNCPPDGLYLANIEYNPEDLKYESSEEQLDRKIREDGESDSENE